MIEDIACWLGNADDRLLVAYIGCNKAVDCVKKWGPCMTQGDFTYRIETVDVEAADGGEECSNFRTETGKRYTLLYSN